MLILIWCSAFLQPGIFFTMDVMVTLQHYLSSINFLVLYILDFVIDLSIDRFVQWK